MSEPGSRLGISARVVAAIGGGYVFAWGFTALALAGLVALGIDFHDAESTAHILALLLYLAVFLWTFAAESLRRVCLVLAGGALSMTVAASALQHLLIR